MQRHRENFDPTCIRDFIDLYLKESGGANRKSYQRWTRIGSIRGSGRVGSDLLLPHIFVHYFLLLVFLLLSLNLPGQQRRPVLLIQDQITSNGYT